LLIHCGTGRRPPEIEKEDGREGGTNRKGKTKRDIMNRKHPAKE
jgi:hypothetical protein